MKKIITLMLVLAAVIAVNAGQVNPTSNVLGDTAATANTLVLRDGSGNMAIAAADISAGAVTTTKLGSGAVTTSRVFLDLITSKVLCVTSGRIPGVCSDAPGVGGGCTCS